jgi:hypothetical protein
MGSTTVLHSGPFISAGAVNSDRGLFHPTTWAITYGSSTRYDGYGGLSATTPQFVRQQWNADYLSGTAIPTINLIGASPGLFEDIGVRVTLSGYEYDAVVSVVVDPINGACHAAVLNEDLFTDTHGYGKPTYGCNTNAGVTLNNANYTSTNAVTVYATHRGFAGVGIPWTQY